MALKRIPVRPSSAAWGRSSGPRVARVFHRLLGLVFLVAFLSLGAQVDVLVGSRGLLPVADVARSLAERADVAWYDFPSFFRLGASDGAIRAHVVLGVLLSLWALLGPLPRLAYLGLVPLYLSLALAYRDFLSFQWDNLLLECGALALFLPRDRRAPVAHLLFRCLLFKLYFESGIAKWQSHLLDWHDGSAMVAYYETAPLPAWPAWSAHHLPEAWHHLESRLALGVEMFASLLVFAPRTGRLVAFALLTGFQVANLLTANYGFFVWLSLALHVFLLADEDPRRVRRALTRPLRRLLAGPTPPAELATPIQRRVRAAAAALRRHVLVRRAAWLHVLRRTRAQRWRSALAAAVMTVVAPVWLGLSFREALVAFTSPSERCDEIRPRECIGRGGGVQAFLDGTEEAAGAARAFRLVHVYHLFGHITTERVEPEVQTRSAAAAPGLSPADPEAGWTAHHLHYKPGPVDRPPPFVAPHQPRVDFLLWFYGLGFRRGMPLYVRNLLDRMCRDPEAVQELFADPLPAAPAEVRIAFWRYRFSDAETRARTGAWWTRERIGALRPLRCDR